MQENDGGEKDMEAKRMQEEIYTQTCKMMEEFGEKAGLKQGDLLVVGCSTSEIIGSRIGSNSSPDAAEWVFQGIQEYTGRKGIRLAIQCCEHLNRALVTERESLPFAETVNVVPQPKAGGSLAARAYQMFRDPVVVEALKADAGIDIGLTMIGMHLKKVAVPIRLEHGRIGEAIVTAARTRPKFIGGSRAVYDEELL